MSRKQALCRQLQTCSPWKLEDHRAGPPWLRDPFQGLPALVVRPPTALLADTRAGGTSSAVVTRLDP